MHEKGGNEPWEEGGPNTQVRGEFYGVKSVDGDHTNVVWNTRDTQPVLSTPDLVLGENRAFLRR